jgi:hypothetical protein
LLDLAENNLIGSIPVSFGNFTYMEIEPNMFPPDTPKRNTFNASMYSQDGQMDIIWKGRDYSFGRSVVLLTGIDLSSNSLSGEIPAELLKLQQLRFLNLS